MTSLAKCFGILQARVSSSRLPGKVLADIVGKPMVLRQIERIARARRLAGIVLATSTDPSDDPLADAVSAAGVALYRGSLEDVLGRFVGAARSVGAETVVRLTGDCPLADPELIDAIVERHCQTGADITTNSVEATFPDGLDAEVVGFEQLAAAEREATLTLEREHVTQFFYRRSSRFRIEHYKQSPDLSDMRWTVDRPSDLLFARTVYEALYPGHPAFGTRDVLALLAERPEIGRLNAGIVRNEGLAKSAAQKT
jgi:spore coat polysaccharide biosynthesis protein SpsF